MILTSKNMRNELLFNYHKLKKIPDIMTTNLKSEISERLRGVLFHPQFSLYATWGFKLDLYDICE